MSSLCILIALYNAQAEGEWPAYGKDPGGMRYARETQITKGNVARLKEAWTFHTGDLSDTVNKPSSGFECTPLYVDGTLYVVSPFNRVFAIDPDTGKPKWTYDPKIPKERPLAVETFVCRGVSSWKDPTTGRRRILLATHDARLIAIDAATGRAIPSFGHLGAVNLRVGVGKYYLPRYNETSAPCVIGDLVVVGSSIGDNGAADMPSGVVRAFEARSGKLRWSWDPCALLPTVTKALDPAGQAYLEEHGGSMRTGAGNAWSTLSADVGRDLVFIPTGSASPDFCGMLRPGNNADADSVVALRASTGEKVWAFQTVHHNLWDYDVPAQPILCDVAGKPSVVVMTKMGHVFVLDRLTGTPLLPVEERQVPTDGVPGEPVSPTQPFPVLPKPLVSDRFEPWALQPKDVEFIRGRIKGARTGLIFTPPSIGGTVIYPGNIGGSNWSGGSYDPSSNTLFVNTSSLATLLYLVPRDNVEKEREDYRGHEIASQLGTPYGIRREVIFSPGQVPGNKPPWGMLHAIDLSSGEIRWQVPLGVMPQYEGLPRAREWGSPNLGGSFATSTGLVFISATMDARIRAFDSDSGNILWEHKLPAPGNATPMTFTSARSGRQYVVQCAGGRHGLAQLESDSVVAFAVR